MMTKTWGKAAALALCAALAGGSAFGADYSLCFVSLPAEYYYFDSTVGAAGESKSSNMGFESAGFRLTHGLNQYVGVFSLAVEAGFTMPAGGQSFSRSLEVEFPPSGATKNDTNEGDYFEWKVATVPLFLAMKVVQPAPQVGFTAQLAAGPMLVSVIEEETESIFNSAGDLLQKSTTRRQFAAAAFAAELSGGINLQASNDYVFNLTGGLIWVSDVSNKTVQDAPAPVRTEGINIGGIGYVVKAGISAAI